MQLSTILRRLAQLLLQLAAQLDRPARREDLQVLVHDARTGRWGPGW